MRAIILPVFVILSAGASASAQTAPDGVYGRLRGDLSLSVEALGGAADTGAWSGAGSFALRARALDMVGVVLGYDRAFSGPRFDYAFASVDFRPAFFARWSLDMEHGPGWLDLFLDSIGIELGAAWIRPGSSDATGVGFVVGGGADVPVYIGDRTAWSLRLAARYLSSKPWDAQGTGRDDSAVEVLAGVVFRTMVGAGLTRVR
jgi:hypothetical protein